MKPLTWGFILILAIGMMFGLFNFNFWRSFEERESRVSLNYAVNTASDLSTDYLLQYSQETPYGNIFIEPEQVWYIYRYALLKSVGLYSEKNMTDVEHFFPTVIIAVNDGYFMHLLTQEDTETHSIDGTLIAGGTEAEWEYKFSQKIPFARQPIIETSTTGYIAELNEEDPYIPETSVSNPVIIADTLNGKNIIAYYPNSHKYIKYQVDGRSVRSNIGSAHSVPEIGLEILTALDYSMSWNGSRNSVYKKGGVMQIPIEVTKQLSSDNVNLIGPQVMVICDQFNWIGNKAMSFFTISTSQIVENTMYYCYTRDGEKFYSTVKPDDMQIEQIYTQQSQCALEGYYPDPNYYD